jgi:hypothetical protein
LGVIPPLRGSPPLGSLPNLIYEHTKKSPCFNVGGRVYNSIIKKEGDTMEDNYIQEIFDQFHAGEIDVLELMDELETARFDGDIIDFL